MVRSVDSEECAWLGVWMVRSVDGEDQVCMVRSVHGEACMVRSVDGEVCTVRSVHGEECGW